MQRQKDQGRKDRLHPCLVRLGEHGGHGNAERIEYPGQGCSRRLGDDEMPDLAGLGQRRKAGAGRQKADDQRGGGGAEDRQGQPALAQSFGTVLVSRRMKERDAQPVHREGGEKHPGRDHPRYSRSRRAEEDQPQNGRRHHRGLRANQLVDDERAPRDRRRKQHRNLRLGKGQRRAICAEDPEEGDVGEHTERQQRAESVRDEGG